MFIDTSIEPSTDMSIAEQAGVVAGGKKPQLEVGFGGSALLDGPRRAPAPAAAPEDVVDLSD